MIKIFFFVLLVAGCQKKSQYQVYSTNPNFNVEVLFEVDGIKVYRFVDDGRSHYFCTKGSQGICMSGYTIPCGKYNSVYIPEEIVNFEEVQRRMKEKK